jgi:outer membrane protein assembly factor BamB
MGNDGALRLYDKAGDLLWEYTIDTSILAGDKYSVCISADGRYIAAGNRDNDQLRFFERDQQLLWSYTTGPIEGVSVSVDGSHIVAASRDNIYLFDHNQNLLWTFDISDIEDVAMSADADLIVAVTEDNKVYALSPPP